MEANQTLTITGNLFVDGGGDAVVKTLGTFNVLTKLVVPVQAQGISTSGSTGPSAAEIAQAIMAQLEASSGIPANIKWVNDVSITGAGVLGNEWGPAP
jgi:hypothetical protein